MTKLIHPYAWLERNPGKALTIDAGLDVYIPAEGVGARFSLGGGRGDAPIRKQRADLADEIIPRPGPIVKSTRFPGSAYRG